MQPQVTTLRITTPAAPQGPVDTAQRGAASALNLAWSAVDRIGSPAPARAAGDAAGAADPEVARAREHYRPELGSLGRRDAARAQQLVAEALEGLEPRLVVHRWKETLDGFLDGRDPYLPTIHDVRPPGMVGAAQERVRAWREMWRGMHGTGERAGHTAYASVQFTPRGTPHGPPPAGVSAFGDVRLELSPAVADRTTVAAADTGYGMSRVRVAPLERLADVVVERLARTQGFVPDPMSDSLRAQPIGPATDAAGRRADLLRLVNDQPRLDAVRAVREYLTSDALSVGTGIIEAQVRGVTLRDVRSIDGLDGEASEQIAQPAAAAVSGRHRAA